jgi:hypothetical protein
MATGRSEVEKKRKTNCLERRMSNGHHCWKRIGKKEENFLPRGAYVEWPLEEAKCEGKLFGRGLQPGRYIKDIIIYVGNYCLQNLQANCLGVGCMQPFM